MTELWLDDAPGERRAALVEDGAIVEVHIQRELHRGLSETGFGRVDRKTPSGAYVVTDGGDEILVRRGSPKPEGSRVGFEITREAICEPGRIKPPEAALLDTEPQAMQDKEQLWQERLAKYDALPRQNSDISAAFDAALLGASQVGDATMAFQRTKAGLVFDIDGIGNPLQVNITAAEEIARLLRLYQVGGMVMIDFIAVDSKRQRQAIAAAFDNAAAPDPRPFERSAVNGFGLMQVVRARPRPSVLDHLFGTRIAALSDETQALWLLREAAHLQGFGTRTVTAKAAIVNLLGSSDWTGFRAACQRQMGAALAIVADDNITGYGHVHVAQS